MFYNITKTSRTIHIDKTNDITGIILLKWVVKEIYDLNIFKSIGPKIREDDGAVSPACIVTPRTVNIAEANLNGKTFDMQYTFRLGYLLRTPSDDVLVQEALYYNTKLLKHFSYDSSNGSNKRLCGLLAGHYNTNVEASSIEAVGAYSNGVFAFDSGINVVFNVWESF